MSDCPNLLQVFVETLDKCFENVCELDLIFHMDKVSSLHSFQPSSWLDLTLFTLRAVTDTTQVFSQQ